MVATLDNVLRRVVSLQPADNAIGSQAGSPYASRPGALSLIDRHPLTIETRQGLLHQPLPAKGVCTIFSILRSILPPGQARTSAHI